MSESSKQATVTKEQTGETMSLHSWIGENSSVLVKLMVFTAALFAFPIVTFFATLHSLFDGNTTYAGGAAALMANVIVGLYIVVAMLEKPRDSVTSEKKKD
ncbi:unnamed protein product [Mucor circinelloides]|uniref:Uncharacterized protein n=1 Tax=Mucor circinelloides f. circinelloides (strain 1006PhL) TaxID=1220926 RepID=S2JD61_MUCC1|nr:hypothetical protein HMPREF1544_04929 [Mucor circinelloides 1006PhL]KAG1095105.1 hypothetical protein G6F42_018616 [Rhizopus arrhizus]